MLKTHWRTISLIERIGDNTIVIVSFFLAYYFRDSALHRFAQIGLNVPRETAALAPIESYLIVLGIALPLVNAFLSLLGGYRSMRFESLLGIFRISSLTAALVFVSVGSVLFLLKLDLSRSFVALFCILSGVAIFAERAFVLELLRYWRTRGRNFRSVLIVGTGAQARKLFYELVREPALGVRVAGFVSLNREVPNRPALQALRVNADRSSAITAPDPISHSASAVYDLPARVVATPDTFESALKRYTVDEILVTDLLSNFGVINDLVQIAVEEGVGVTLAADFFSVGIFRSDVSYFRSVPLIHYQPSPGDAGALALKRALDVVIASTLLVLLSPFLLLTAAAIKLDSAGPVFFRQKRVGLNGRIFTLLKFRSMVEGAESLLHNLRALNEMEGPVFKMKHDPRVTRVGRFIRRFSVDELPQLINVIRGDMSLVGPRPPLPDEVSLYLRRHRRRLSMRPGLTCTWQVSGRNNIPDFEQWAELDLEYIDNWSLTNDLKLLLRTIPAVLGGMGAR